jgi:hypothetical protein
MSRVQGCLHFSRLSNSFKSFNHHHAVTAYDLHRQVKTFTTQGDAVIWLNVQRGWYKWQCKESQLMQRYKTQPLLWVGCLEKLERDTEVGTLTTMPISVVSFPLTSNVLSSTKFMNWSKPRRTPITFRLAFNFTATISSNRFRDKEHSERHFQEQYWGWQWASSM